MTLHKNHCPLKNRRAVAGMCRTLKKMRLKEKVPVTREMIRQFLKDIDRYPGRKRGGLHTRDVQTDGSRCGCRARSTPKKSSSKKIRKKCRPEPGLIKKLMKMIFKKKKPMCKPKKKKVRSKHRRPCKKIRRRS
ncbi:uncharacterized protein LOC129002007 [Macrosteles quadrilineatus]|uniref:uncharacterized protein LOC129002007 n=1 Tax=Macrosteles quadrilineatus TaxID=74068 RepID=UPI0023E2929E|nr:uncharacterized protein LOC129002007 [Macrosteles quadrilineatus]